MTIAGSIFLLSRNLRFCWFFVFNCRFWRKFRPARIVLTRWIFSVLGNLFFTVLSYIVDWINIKSKFMKQFNRTKAEIKFFTFWKFQFYFNSDRFILLHRLETIKIQPFKVIQKVWSLILILWISVVWEKQNYPDNKFKSFVLLNYRY